MDELEEVSDTALLASMARGEPFAFERFYGRMEGPLMALCAAILRRRGMAEEALQETFLKFLGQKGRWGEIRNPRAYLLQSARRIAWRLRQRERAPSATEILPFVEASDHAPPELLHHQEWMDQALGRLSEAQREVLVLKHLSGLTLAEAAEVLEENPKTVEGRYAAGMARLRELLKEDAP